MKLKIAVARYIASKSAILSPSTIAGYTRYSRLYLQRIYDMDIEDITQEDFQLAVNDDVIDGRSPKTIRNAVGLVKVTLKMFAPEKRFYISQPQKIRPSFYVPDKIEIQHIYSKIKGRELEIPFLLASQCGLRPSEISALTLDDVCHGYVDITKARVRGLKGDVLKAPKTYCGNRSIPIPKELEELIITRSSNGRICLLTSKQISEHWSRFLSEQGIRYFKFYALRHYFASEALLLGVPQKYIAEMMGHSSLEMIERVYQHTFPSAMERYKAVICENTLSVLDVG